MIYSKEDKINKTKIRVVSTPYNDFDPLFRQYLSARHSYYVHQTGWETGSDIDEFDEKSQFHLLLIDDFFVGGFRVIPGNIYRLPIEDLVNINKRNCQEVSRLVLNPDMPQKEKGVFLGMLCETVIQKSRQRNTYAVLHSIVYKHIRSSMDDNLIPLGVKVRHHNSFFETVKIVCKEDIVEETDYVPTYRVGEYRVAA